MKETPWVRLLAYVTGLINQEILLKNEYLAAENRILRAHLPARMRLSDPERSTLAEVGKRLGRKALAQVACVAKPDTILAWYRKLIAQKLDGSKHRRYPGRPPIAPKLEELIVKMAREHSGWGYERIVGALSNLGYTVSDQTVGNVRQAGHRTGAETQSKHDVEGIDSIASGGVRWDRLLHRRSPDLARPSGNVVLRPGLGPGGAASPSAAIVVRFHIDRVS
jgi:hypothetical protein